MKENIIDVEIIGGGINRSFLNYPIGEGDRRADKIGVRVLENKQPKNLRGGSCVGYFIRPDGITLVINGTILGEVAYIVLPTAAYAVEGVFTLAINITTSDYSDTVRIVDGTVVNTRTSTINDPSSVVPDVSAIAALIEEAEAAANIVNSLTVSTELITGTRYALTVDKGE